MPHEVYESPLTSRYASDAMLRLFSDHFKYTTWRKLWTALAEAQQQLGLPITAEQITALKANVETIDFAAAAAYEQKLHHDVMAHIRAYGDQCPFAQPIIHLGATSCYVTDNGDLIQMREGLILLHHKLQRVIQQLSDFALQYASMPCLGYTHFQPAQLTTVGKRACLWIQDLLLDKQEIEYRLSTLRFLGVKGAIGTQASFLTLFDGDASKVQELDRIVTQKMGFSDSYPIAGQTYTRKQDIFIGHAVAGVGASAHKMATDIRLLAHLREIQEPFADTQVGSTAMPYKRNPILSERICGLARFLISLDANPSYTASTQWLERSLDDSANRRLVIPEIFLTADAILELLLKLTSHLVVHPEVIAKHVEQELPLIATETILMTAVKKGGDRQQLHERLRQLTLKEDREHLLQAISADKSFRLSLEELQQLIKPESFIGLATQQVHAFLQDVQDIKKDRSG